MNYYDIIAQSDLAEDLDPDDIRKLAQIAEPQEYEAGDVIIKEDDTTCDMFLIYKGCVSVEIQRYPYDTSSERLHLLRNRGVVGEFSFIDRSRRSANVLAKEAASCLKFPCGALERLIEEDHKIGYIVIRNIARLLCARIRNTNYELRNQLIW